MTAHHFRATRRSSSLRFALGFSGLLLAFTAWSSDIKSYSASYSASFNGLEIEAKHRLEQLDSGQYRETLKAKNFLGKIDEQALFEVAENQTIVPLEYNYQRSLVGVKRAERQVFNWASKQLEYSKKDLTEIVELPPGALDIITHKVQLRRDLQTGKKILSYPVISRGKLKQYEYQIIEETVLDTAIGPLNTILVQRIREDDRRQTSIWLATDWDYLAVKLEQIEDGESHQMSIINAQVDNQPVTPLETVTEK
ncbi:MAG: DUF3108 domain-containing protein [Porticoccaceae bacterium]|jgi:hypothetical protein|nr:DUF3108 domain-containing protein [Porticoccaceae bacterium]MBT5577287.1 DUF3108 domain-containing protein [Porticoccaceae bacterium]